VDDLSFGEYSANTSDLPANLRSLFFTSTDSSVTIASKSIDLGNITGNTITIFLSGFIVPADNESGPVLGFYGVDQAGNTIELGLPLSIPINEILTDLSIYPNPASNFLNIDFSYDGSEMLDLYLTNLSGSILLNETLPANQSRINHTLDLPDLPNGLYLLSISNQNDALAVPIVIFR
jgi:hypothetical protein